MQPTFAKLLCAVLVLSSVGAANGALAQTTDAAPRFLYVSSERSAPVAVDISRTPMLRQRLMLDLNNASVKDALAEITRQSGIRIFYVDNLIARAERKSLRAEGITVAAALTDVLSDLDVDLVFSGDASATIVKRNRSIALRQTGTIVGRVTDAENAGIAGVSLSVEGTRLGATTDGHGAYVLHQVPVGERTIRARRLGYRTKSRSVTITDGDTVTADLVLARAPTMLSEIVVTPTGARQRLEIGNAIGTIRADSLVPTTLIRTVSDLLTARTPGVVVSSAGGAAGAPSMIRIRGVNSMLLNNDPVIILDGVRLNSQVSSASSQTNIGNAVGQFGSTTSGGRSDPAPSRIDDIDPNIIESIDILRGPSATSLYGTEAANGVVVIKTKRGRVGTFRYNVLADQGQSRLPNELPDMWFGWGRLPNGSPTTFCSLRMASEGSCVQDSVTHFNPANHPEMSTLGTGSTRSVSASASGGSDRVSQFLSVRYSDQVGMAKLSDVEERRIARMWSTPAPSWMRRPNTATDINGSSRTTMKFGSDIDVSLNANLVYRRVQSGNAGLSDNLTSFTSESNVYLGTPAGLSDTLAFLPAEIQAARKVVLAKRGYGGVDVNYVPASWLTLRATVGADYTIRSDDGLRRSTDCTAILNPSGCPSGHSNARGETFVTTMDLGAHVNYPLTSWLTSRTAFGEQFTNVKYYELSAGNNSGTTLAFGTDLLTPTPVPRSGSPQLYRVLESRDESATAGWYLEQGFALRDRLFLSAGFRQDAASAFGPTVNRKLPTYPKANVSWLVSEEPFFPYSSFVSSVRLRASYGHSGNQGRQADVLNNYTLITAFPEGTSTAGIALTQVGNPDLKPERSTEWDGGIDIALFGNDRVRVEASVYRKLSRDAIMITRLPGSLGIHSGQFFSTTSNLFQRANVGSVENRGLELAVGARPIDTRAFAWDVNINYSRNRNKLVSKAPSAFGSSLVEGFPIFGYWSPEIVSYDDVNGDGILGRGEVIYSAGDPRSPIGGYTFKGAPYPSSEVTWDNGFTMLGGALRVGSKFDQVNGAMSNMVIHSSTRHGVRCMYDPTCSLAEQATMMEALEVPFTPNQRPHSTLRFSELSVTYNLSPVIARRVRAQSAAITIAGRNLAVWSTYARGDPNRSGGTGGLREDFQEFGVTYPQPRNWMIRANLGF